ncbi:MAG: hypothetical protein JJ896_16980 [Rhodothermales bacterium]|nr:hypothetical protein [Rhodothermales bacterium]MBO6781354.1 hypothetical protein [Rhodothermales bacterium]
MNRIEAAVDAAAAELGSAAAASAVQALAERALGHWPEGQLPQGLLGAQVEIRPAPVSGARPVDACEAGWELLSRAVTATPRHVPTVPILYSLSRLADTLDGETLLRLAASLDQVILGSATPALRLEWADGLSSRRGDALVLRHLAEITASTRALCGHVRTGDGSGRVCEASIARTADSRGNGPIGLSSGPEDQGPEGLTIRPVGRAASPAHRVAFQAWTTVTAYDAGTRTGLPSVSGPGLVDFDTPEASHTALYGPNRRVWI